MKKTDMRKLLLIMLLFICGQAYFGEFNVITPAVFANLISCGCNTMYLLVVAVSGCVAGWFYDGNVSVMSLFCTVMPVFLTALIINSGRMKAKVTGRKAAISYICCAVTFWSAYTVMYGFNLMGFAYAVLLIAMCVLLENGIHRIMYGGIISSTKEEVISFIVLACIGLKCIPPIYNRYFSIKLTIIMFIVLWLSYNYSFGYTALVAVCLFATQSGNLRYFFVYSTVAVAACMTAMTVNELGKTVCAVTFVFVTGIFHMILKMNIQYIGVADIHVPAAAASAAILLIFLPVKKKGIREYNELENDFVNYQYRLGIKKMLGNLSHELMSLASKMQKGCDLIKADEEDMGTKMLEGVAVTVCNACDKRQVCWQNNYDKTVDGIEQVIENVYYNKNAYDVMNCMDECINTTGIVQSAVEGALNFKNNIRVTNNLLKMREAMGIQMQEVAGIINDYVAGLDNPVKISYSKKIRLIRRMFKYGIITDGISAFRKSDGRMIIRLSARTNVKEGVAIGKASLVLSGVIGRKIVAGKNEQRLIDEEQRIYTFVEKTNYKVFTAVAGASKEENDVNGDSYSCMQTADKNVVMIIADGMGSGPDAYASSSEAIDILESFMEAGFKPQTCVSLLNSVMLHNADGVKSTTIDICRVNRYTGICNFTKVGAAPSFIKRNNTVDVIETHNCPVGITQDAWCDTVVKKLYDGNYVIMVSDGAIECMDDGVSKLAHFIGTINSCNAQEIANDVLKFCVDISNNDIEDDITVIVAGIWA